MLAAVVYVPATRRGAEPSDSTTASDEVVTLPLEVPPDLRWDAAAEEIETLMTDLEVLEQRADQSWEQPALSSDQNQAQQESTP
jgi:hypothetical protein